MLEKDIIRNVLLNHQYANAKEYQVNMWIKFCWRIPAMMISNILPQKPFAI